MPEPAHEPAELGTQVEEVEPAVQQRPVDSGSMTGVQAAIEEVNEIIQHLREALDEMDGVLEALELAERQKNADEHEIESLRRTLRQVHRPREGGSSQPKGHA